MIGQKLIGKGEGVKKGAIAGLALWGCLEELEEGADNPHVTWRAIGVQLSVLLRDVYFLKGQNVRVKLGNRLRLRFLLLRSTLLVLLAISLLLGCPVRNGLLVVGGGLADSLELAQHLTLLEVLQAPLDFLNRCFALLVIFFVLVLFIVALGECITEEASAMLDVVERIGEVLRPKRPAPRHSESSLVDPGK